MMRRSAVATAVVALMAATPGCGGKAEPTTVLLSVRNAGVGGIPEEARLNVYDRFGRLFPETRLPAQGTLTPANPPLLGTIVLYLKDAPTELRLEAHGLASASLVSQGAVRANPQSGRQIAVDLVLEAGPLPDVDEDGVPDLIDDCVYVSNALQGDGNGDGIGDVCAGSDAGVRGGTPNGSACTVDLSCDSRHCADGLCCDTDCLEACHSCALPNARGTCTLIPQGQDAQGDCPAEPATSCGRTGECGPNGTCALYSDGTTCVAAVCAAGVQSSDRTCDGAGTCRAATETECGIYACSGTACAVSCATDAACATGYYCDSAACVPKLDVAATCGAANQCATGFCFDGVCCATDCSGPCKSCAAPQAGVCTSYPGGTDPDADCPGGLACTGAGACYTRCAADAPDCESGYYCGATACVATKDNGAACGAANECKSGFCADGVCCTEACTETCRSCNLSGSIGTCAFVPSGSRETTGPNPCGPPNRCDGAGVCQ